MSDVRLRKWRDPHQQRTWNQNKDEMLNFFRDQSTEEFTVDNLSEKLKLSTTTVRRHLPFLVKAEVIRRDERERPVKYRLRPFWPIRLALIGKFQETLRYAPVSEQSVPDSLTFPLNDKCDVTISWTGKEYSRFYHLKLKEPGIRFEEQITMG